MADAADIIDLDVAVATLRPPKTRGDCAHGVRPCPWVRCKWHMVWEHQQGATRGFGRYTYHPEQVDIFDLADTCVLDVADRGPVTLEEVGNAIGSSRERVRQIEAKALSRLSKNPEARDLLHLVSTTLIPADVSPPARHTQVSPKPKLSRALLRVHEEVARHQRLHGVGLSLTELRDRLNMDVATVSACARNHPDLVEVRRVVELRAAPEPEEPVVDLPAKDAPMPAPEKKHVVTTPPSACGTTTSVEVTPRQLKVLRVIEAFVTVNGTQPTSADIGERMHVSAHSVAATIRGGRNNELKHHVVLEEGRWRLLGGRRFVLREGAKTPAPRATLRAVQKQQTKAARSKGGPAPWAPSSADETMSINGREVTALEQVNRRLEGIERRLRALEDQGRSSERLDAVAVFAAAHDLKESATEVIRWLIKGDGETAQVFLDRFKEEAAAS